MSLSTDGEGRPKFNPRSGLGLNPEPSGWQSVILPNLPTSQPVISLWIINVFVCIQLYLSVRTCFVWLTLGWPIYCNKLTQGGGGVIWTPSPSYISQKVAHTRSSFGMDAALSLLVTLNNNNQVLIKNCCYGNGRFTTWPPSWPPSWIFKIFILCKTAADFTEISRKRVFAASNRNIIENRV